MKRIRRAYNEWLDAAKHPVLRKPTVLQFPVNDICNSRCQMCRIWEQKRDEEISPEQLGLALADPFFDEVEEIGLNGGEPTLRPDLTRLAEVLMDRLPRLRGVSLITNAIREKRVVAAVEELGALCRERGKHLDVMVSLDGVGEVHDRVRGVPGNFRSAMAVLDYLQASRVVDSYRIGCTIIAENVFDVENVLTLAKGRGVYARFRLGVPHPRLYSAHLREPFALGEAAIFHTAAFLDTLICDYEKSEARRAFYVSLRDQLTDGRSRAAGCAWRNHGATLGPRGELSYCAVASPVLGRVQDASSAGLYWGGREVLEGILRDKCSDCRHDYEGVGSRGVLMRIWAKRLARKCPPALVNTLRAAWRPLVDWRNYHLRLAPKAPVSAPESAMRVLLAGWYGTETLGDRAILAGLCDLVHEARPGVLIEVASLNPYVTRETARLMPTVGIARVLDLRTAASEITAGRYAAVAVAGGPLMTPVREVIDLKNLLQAARKAGARTALLGCGLGPIRGRGARYAAIRRMVSEADVCVLRDAASAALARRCFGRTVGVATSVDPAFFWAAARTAVIPKKTGCGLMVALALREWITHEYAAGLDESRALEVKARFEAELRLLVRRLKEAEPSVQVIPVCMHTLTQGGDDRWFYHGLFADDPDMRASVSWKRRTPEEEFALLRAADGVVAMRFHSVVFSLALAKPMLAIDYTLGGKIAALLADTGNERLLASLVRFDGTAAADRLLADIAMNRRPNGLELGAAREIYRQAIGQMLPTPASG